MLKIKARGRGKVILIFLFVASLTIKVFSEGGNNYLFIGVRLYDFQFSESPPFERYEDMQWDEENGFYGISESAERLGVFIDFPNQRFAYIWKDGGRCFLLFMRPEYGKDGNPHVSDLAWISCTEISP